MEDLLAAPWQAKIALLVLFVAMGVSVVTDLRKRLILNVVTLPGLAIIAVCIFWLGGLALLAEAAVGVLICAGPLAVMMLLGWMGAGDVKLIALSGAVSAAAAGWPFSLTILLYVAVAGGLQSALWMLAAKLRGRDRPKYVPYGVSIAAGTLTAFLFGRALL
jgi:prepilin peptidase CpaA